MNAVGAVLGRELRIVFGTPLAWVALAAFSLVTALLFWLELLSFEAAQQRALATNDPALLSLLDFNDLLLGSVFLHAQVLLLFIVPLLTMRLFAEEARQGTFDLLLSSPVRTSSLVAGKLLGVLVVLALAGVVLLVYPVLLQVFGRAVVQGDGVVDWPQALAGVCGVVACAAVSASLGAVLSAATTSPAAAALATALTLVGLWLGGSAAAALDGPAGFALAWLSPATHLDRFVRGIVALPDLVYVAASIGACAVVTHRLVDARRRA